MSWLQKWVDRVFKLEIIKSGDNCPPYMFRWWLTTWFGWKVYLHHFVGDDAARDLHDHPRRFISIGLWGRYVEETPFRDQHGGESTVLVDKRLYVAPWWRSFSPEHRHRIVMAPKPGRKPSCWTLVLVGPLEREWGFWVRGKFIRWDIYENAPAGEYTRDC